MSGALNWDSATKVGHEIQNRLALEFALARKEPDSRPATGGGSGDHPQRAHACRQPEGWILNGSGQKTRITTADSTAV
jgi:hypothetical protein